MRGKPIGTVLVFLGALLAVSQPVSGQKPGKTAKKEVENMVLTSPAFKEGEIIPRDYTCEGKDLSPPLQWKGVPESTESFALICDDPDAPGGTWVHWVIWNIPATASGLPEGLEPEKELKDGTRQGKNDFRRIGYGGPCPPPGPAHRYFFKLYALDRKLELRAGATKPELLKAMQGHILAEAHLMGKYKR